VALDIFSVVGGIGLAVVGFAVVILVCVVILRMLAAVLPSYEGRSAAAGTEEPGDAMTAEQEVSDPEAAGPVESDPPSTD
jgi:hypothetical protein